MRKFPVAKGRDCLRELKQAMSAQTDYGLSMPDIALAVYNVSAVAIKECVVFQQPRKCRCRVVWKAQRNDLLFCSNQFDMTVFLCYVFLY